MKCCSASVTGRGEVADLRAAAGSGVTPECEDYVTGSFF